MKVRIAATAGLLALTANTTFAAPVTYNFSTGPSPFVSVFNGAPIAPSLFSAGGASGSFVYDSSAILLAVQSNGSFYAAHTPQSVTGNVNSLSGLSAQIGSFAFSDNAGGTFVSNDRFTGFGSPSNVDQVSLLFEPPAGAPGPHNLSGFQVDGWTLLNVRMLWIEGIGTGGPVIQDFLSNESLPGAPPAFTGRLWLDFYKTDNPNITGFVFYNGLSVYAANPIPEPETYAMLLAGLALMGMVARRRQRHAIS